MSRERHIQQEFYEAGQLDLVAKALTGSHNSRAIACEGFNQLTLEFDLTYGAVTAVTFYIQISRDGTTWRRVMVGDIDPATGIESLLPRQWSRAVSGSENFAVNIPINAKFCRIQTLTGTGSPTSDVVSVGATLGVV